MYLATIRFFTQRTNKDDETTLAYDSPLHKGCVQDTTVVISHNEIARPDYLHILPRLKLVHLFTFITVLKPSVW